MLNKRALSILFAIVVFMTTSGFVVSTDLSTNREMLFTGIKGKNSPPTLYIQISTPTGENGWYNTPVFVRAVAHDENSPNIRAMVSVGGTTWYRDALRLAKDGEFIIVAKATDKAGNTARMTQIVKVDMTPPEVTLTIPEPSGLENYHNKSVPVVLTGVDNLSGVVESEIEAFGDSHIVGTNASISIARLSLNESGEYTIEGYVKDEAGNITSVTSDVKLDIDDPEVAINPPMDFKDDIEVSGKAIDLESGIKHVLVDYGEGWSPVEVDNSEWQTIWPAGELEDGKYPIQAKITDRAGNETVVEYQATIVNTLWPFFTIAALLIAIALQTIIDPRKKEWIRIGKEAQKHNQMYQNGLIVGIEKEYRND